MNRAVMSWSGGKDAAVALLELTSRPVRVEELLTTVSEATGRSSMHGVRRALYEQQADALGMPITILELPPSPTNEEYEAVMSEQLARYENRGIDRMVFGDLFLEDVRAYREDRLADVAIDGCWPIWGMNSSDLLDRFLEAGFEAIVVAVDDDHFGPEDVGARLDRTFLETLPSEVDPAGEHGAFHTFVVDGPMFERRLRVERGEVVSNEVGEETTMHYCDLLIKNRSE